MSRERREPAAERIARIKAQMLQHGGVGSDDMEWMASVTEAAIATEDFIPAHWHDDTTIALRDALAGI